MGFYNPPPKNNIPFSFTSSGYQPPSFSSVPFNFRSSYNSSLSAAINVTQLYQDSTYTFLKYCEQYVIGHRVEGVQIIKGKCHYGGIRDLGATLTAQIGPAATIDLGGIISVHAPENISAAVRGWVSVFRDLQAELIADKLAQDKDLSAQIDTHSPENLRADVKGVGSTFRDLPASLLGEYLKQEINLQAVIDSHQPVDLTARVRIFSTSYRDLPAELIVDQFKQTSDLGSLIDTHLPKDIGGLISAHSPVDLTAKVRIFSSTFRNLPATLISLLTTQELDLSASIGTHDPKDLAASIGLHDPKNITASIRGFALKDLYANVTGVLISNLTAYVKAVIPVDLPAYLKVWPQRDLYGFIHGRQEADLAAYVNVIFSKDLAALIESHAAYNLKASLKGWCIEDFKNLSAMISSSTVVDLPASVLGVSFSDLAGYLFTVRPKDLPGYIHGWQQFDLSAVLTGDAWPWDLPASIIGSGGFVNLQANISPILYSGSYGDLLGYILPTKGITNLAAALGVYQLRELSAYIDTGNDVSNLQAVIMPKMIRLTGILSIITMEHSDLSATISIPCFYSDFRELSAYLRPVFLSNLGAIIHGKNWDGGITNISAKWGFASGYVVQDRLSINVTIAPLPPVGYRVEDKLKLYLYIYRGAKNLSTSIFGELRSVDFPAYIYGVDLPPYNFDGYTGSERVYSHTYSQVLLDFENIAVEFGDIVKDYIYSSGGNIVAKADKYHHFLTKISSYYSKATSERLNKKLHKVKVLYDLRKFESIDAAIKYAIDYVTSYPYVNIGAYIKSIGVYTGITASVNGITTVSTMEDLSSQIDGKMTHPYDVILGFTDDGVGYLQF